METEHYLLRASSMATENYNTKDVFGRLSKLNVWQAPGDDRVIHQILRSCAHVLAEPLCHIFNLSLKTGVFPGQWKTAWIQPIYKNKGERSDPRADPLRSYQVSWKFLSTLYISNLVFCHDALLYGSCFLSWRRSTMPWTRATGYMCVSLTF